MHPSIGQNATVDWRTERKVSFMAEALGNVDLDAAKALLRGRSKIVSR